MEKIASLKRRPNIPVIFISRITVQVTEVIGELVPQRDGLGDTVSCEGCHHEVGGGDRPGGGGGREGRREEGGREG